MAQNEFKPLCIWCSAPWSDDNVKLEDIYASNGCDTCGYGQTVSASLVVTCHSCKKVMYQKGFEEHPNG